MKKYTERRTGRAVEAREITHWLYARNRVDLSYAQDTVEADDILTERREGTTPAILWQGVFYLCDEEEVPVEEQSPAEQARIAAKFPLLDDDGNELEEGKP